METKTFKIKVKYPLKLPIFYQDRVTLHRMEEDISEKDPDIKNILEREKTNWEIKIFENFNDKFKINGIEYNKKDVPYFKLYSPKLKTNIIISAKELEQIINQLLKKVL